MELNDELKLYRGDDYYICDNVYVRQPFVNDICDFGEERYLRITSTLCSVPQNSIYMLNEVGVDFTTISDFQLFVGIRKALDYQQTQILIPNLDFSKSSTILKNKVTSKGTILEAKEVVLAFKDGTIINEKSYKKMISYIRRINRVQRPWFLTVGTESTKKRMIQSAKNEYEKQMSKKTVFESRYLPLISTMSLSGYRNSVWDMKLYEFFDLVERLQLKEQANHLYDGIYNGCVDFNKVKKDLNWMKKIEFNEFETKTNILVKA